MLGADDSYDPWQTMSLRNYEDKPPVYRKQLIKTNDISDIIGAKPSSKIRKINKQDYHHTHDIKGTSPSRLIPKDVNKVIYTNKTDDIEGAQPASNAFITNRAVDPMNPTYKLPSYRQTEPAHIKFLGDRKSNISDISGTSSTRRIKASNGRQTNSLAGIDGAASNWKQKQFVRKDKPRSFGQIQDILGTKRKIVHNTNPLNPEHRINGMIIRTDDAGTRPRELRKGRNGPNLYSTEDIEGANTSFLAKKYIRSHRRDPNDISDIKGSAADSCHHGIRTNRVSNPNDPSYQSLCGTQLGSVQRPFTPDAQHSMFFKSLDLDGDGVVTYDELLQVADKNKDGNLTVEELHKFAKGKISDKALNRLTQAAIPTKGAVKPQPIQPIPLTERSRQDAEIASLRQQLSQLHHEARQYGFPPSTGRSTRSNVSRASAASRRRASRAARQRHADVAAVRNLPDNPLTNAGRSMTR